MKKFFTKIKNFFRKITPSKRKIVQLYTALLYNANIKGFFSGKIYQGATKNLCVPGMNCYSCPGAIGSCPLGSLQKSLYSTDTSMFKYVIGIIALFGLLLGRVVCGWLCPVGLGQELLYKIKTPKLKKSKTTRVLSYLKYFILIGFVVIIPLMYALPGFCEYICPAGTFEGGLGILGNSANEGNLAYLGPIFTWKFTVLVVIIVASIFIFRAFCRFLCPLGALYGLFSKIALLGVKLDKTKCTDCGLCIGVCKMDVKKVGDHECIHCGECISVCPAKAISWKGQSLFIRPNDMDMPASTEVKPLAGMLKSMPVKEEENATDMPVQNPEHMGDSEHE